MNPIILIILSIVITIPFFMLLYALYKDCKENDRLWSKIHEIHLERLNQIDPSFKAKFKAYEQEQQELNKKGNKK